MTDHHLPPTSHPDNFRVAHRANMRGMIALCSRKQPGLITSETKVPMWCPIKDCGGRVVAGVVAGVDEWWCPGCGLIGPGEMFQHAYAGVHLRPEGGPWSSRAPKCVLGHVRELLESGETSLVWSRARGAELWLIREEIERVALEEGVLDEPIL